MKNTKVYLLLKERSSQFLPLLDDAISFAENMLPQINRVFNTYTIHGMQHAVNVAGYMFGLIGETDEISDLELSMMIYAALFHDMGMIAENDEIKNIKEDKLLVGGRKYSKVLEKYKDENIALQECIRPMHGIRTKTFIDNQAKQMFLIPGTTDVSIQHELGLICQAHTEDFDWIVSNLRNDIRKGDWFLNAQYIALLLRIGDYLDIDEKRAPLYLYKYLNPSEYSDLEWRQHFNIENFKKIQMDEKTGLKEIVFQGKSDDAVIHRKLLNYFDNVSQELYNAVSLSEKFEQKKYLLGIKTHVVQKIITSGFSFSNYQLKLDYKAVTNLLMGEHIYGDKKYGLRELVQNSIDACKTMQELAETLKEFRFQKYAPFIYIVIDYDESCVHLIDNGSGMSIDILKKYFLNVGMSYYKSDDYILQDRKYSPIGHYGIGFLACFMLSDKVMVNTKTIEDSKRIKIEFEKNSEYICMAFEEYSKQGTEIVLEYDSFMEPFGYQIENVREFIETNFLDAGIPISIIVIKDGITREEKCELNTVGNLMSTGICLDDYLDGIQVSLVGNFKNLYFIKGVEDINGGNSFYYNAELNVLCAEDSNVFQIKDYVEDGLLKYVTIPIIDDDAKDDFLKAFDVLDNFDQALERINNYDQINIIPLRTENINKYIVDDEDEVIVGDYTYGLLCADTGHSSSVPTQASVVYDHIVTNDNTNMILMYRKGIPFNPRNIWEKTCKIYLKNVLLVNADIVIPYSVDGILVQSGIINITNKHFIPNVSRDNISKSLKAELAYAIGKAIHLWLLDNVDLGQEERSLLEDFIQLHYPENNHCLKDVNYRLDSLKS